MKRISKFALLILVVAILVLIFRGDLLSSSPFVITAQIAALALNVWSRSSFGAGQLKIGPEPGQGALLRKGPYKIVRHPMYASALLFLWASILGHWSLINALIGVVVTAVLAIRISAEEQLLLANFPQYTEYSRRTKRIIPYLI